MPQAPPAHVAVPLAGVGQTLPQLPQLEMSVPVAMHWPAQSLNPVSHAMPHTPFAHVAWPFWGWAQAVPHPLRFAGSVLVSTQAVPHWVVPTGQLTSHLPAEQTSMLLQAMPQLPQLAALV